VNYEGTTVTILKMLGVWIVFFIIFCEIQIDELKYISTFNESYW